ncbi:MAG: hypothetical protein QOI80_1683 [Solirubrobacteraceae bacterium]|nr:hypothetical protein [Solirubrobacteraceae bacterium]
MARCGVVEASREARLRRAWRQAVTLVRAIRAARTRIKAEAPQPRVDGAVLRDLLAEAATDVRQVDVRVNRPPWTATGIHVGAGERATWLAWDRLTSQGRWASGGGRAWS